VGRPGKKQKDRSKITSAAGDGQWGHHEFAAITNAANRFGSHVHGRTIRRDVALFIQIQWSKKNGFRRFG